MYRCPSCVSIVVDTTVRRCPICGENFKRHPPTVLGLANRTSAKVTSWDLAASVEASKMYGQDSNVAVSNVAVSSVTVIEPDIDLPREHERDSSGRTAGAESG